MTETRPPRARTAAIAVAAVVLLGTLVFLFLRAEVGGFKAETQALALLREMQDVHTRWEADALRLANDFTDRPHPAPDRAALFGRIFQEMEQPQVRKAIGELAPALRAGILEKQEAWRALQNGHAASLQALAAARQSLTALAAAVPAAKARSPRSAETLAALAAKVDHLGTLLEVAGVEDVQALGRTLEPRIATIGPAAREADPFLGDAAGRAEASVREFLRARDAEAAAWRRFALLPVGSRIDLAARGLARAVDEALDEKDRWRIYLAAYAAALLIGVGYLFARVMAADAALRAANQQLEARVAERTRELSEALRQLKESEAQLVQTEKMSSLGQLVAGVAHEINTPLAYVKSNVSSVREHLPVLREAVGEARALTELLGADSPDGARLEETYASLAARLERLREEGILEELDTLAGDGMHGIEQIAELVANLRNFSRLDRSRIASFNVNDGVTAALLIARPMLRKVDVEKRLGDLPAITCSPSQVNQVVLNLVTNAAQAIDKPRGRIAATTRREGDDAVAIEIEDNGRGVPPENLQRIFEPFFTTKEPGSGTGLGLAIAYKIVAQHGGRIDVRSQPGEGSTFTVVLPITPPPELAAAAAEKEGAAR